MRRNNRFWIMLSVFSSCLILIGCDPSTGTDSLPALTTSPLNAITQTSAMGGGLITSSVGDPILAVGVCWSTSHKPTVADGKTMDGTEIGFSSTLTGLTANTTYYVRAYATTSKGTGYGNEVSFSTLDASAAVVDADGNIYTTVTIGAQTWLVENLRTTKYRNGDVIGTTTMNISLETTPKYQWTFGAAMPYGLLYTWDAIMDSRNICPVGYHVPTNVEWEALGTEIMYSASALKEAGNAHWITNPGVNTTGFTALPNGYRNGGGTCYLLGTGAYWWTSTEAPTTGTAWTRLMNNTDNSIYKMANYKCAGLGVRCVKD
jgi:uncharacterized protein (TIGR02145 family)